jgi:succinoglycan biosynthesis transport protein ExoP
MASRLPMAIPQEEVSVYDYLRPLFRRRWSVIAIVVLCTAATYGYFENQPKEYQATTKVLLSNGSNPLDASGGLSDREVQDLGVLLGSRDVAAGVARRLGRPADAGNLAGSIATFASSGSNFVEIKATQANPNNAAAVANAFAQAFIRLRTDAVRAQTDKAIEAFQKQLDGLPRTQGNLAARQQIEDSVRQLRLTSAVSTGSATQVDPAVPPAEAAGPRVRRNAALAFVLSLVGAVALAYALQAFDRKPRRLDELSKLYGLPLLTSLPHVDSAEFEHDGQIAVSPAFKEPLRQLRTNIQLASLDTPFKRILITSAIAGEGKSTIVRNLGLVLSEGGLRVAIVDGDLRRPTLATVFHQRSEPGLTDVLTGSTTLEEALIMVPIEAHGLGTLARMGAVTDAPAVPGLSSDTGAIALLPAGPEPADPQAVLSADRTRALLESLSEDFDVVLIDSPPLLHVTDAVALAPWVDAVVVVGRLGHVTQENAKRASEMLDLAGAHPIGLVVNDTPAAESASYGYGYSY